MSLDAVTKSVAVIADRGVSAAGVLVVDALHGATPPVLALDFLGDGQARHSSDFVS